ncbi:threonine ammonia-lyase [Candidatus Poribacteria bacterium]|nr:MAG: threonine ammonia-lyase [Candidatus Poribacteria bacterium]
MKTLTFQDIIAARKVVARFLKQTPLIHYPELSERLGFQAYIKHENHHPTGSFKVRGGLNFMHHLPQVQREKGVITATRGNHGQSIAYAAAQFGVKSTVVVPYGNNPEKNSAMRAFGAELIEHGVDFDGALELCEKLQQERRLYYVHPCMEPALFHGVGTYSLEIFENLPNVDAIIVPIGGGSGCCGAITVSKAINPNVKVIGVQAENAPAIYRSWKAGQRIETDSCDTIADGIATRAPFPLPLSIIKEGIHDIVLLSESELAEGMRLALRWTHNLAEGAGAAPLAAAHKLTDSLAGKNVVMVMSGGNLDTETLKSVLGTR